MSALCLRAAVRRRSSVRRAPQWAAARLVFTRRVIWFSIVVSVEVQVTAAEAGASVTTDTAAQTPKAAVSRATEAAARRTRRVTGKALREAAWRTGASDVASSARHQVDRSGRQRPEGGTRSATGPPPPG